MLCPICRSSLVEGGLERFETLAEHVCCPNEDPEERLTLVCPNTSCIAAKEGVFWSFDGEGPFNSRLLGEYKWIDDNPYPFGSIYRGIYFFVSYNKEDSELCLGPIMITRKVRYRSDDFGNRVGRFTRYELWTRANGSYTRVNGIHMFFYLVRLVSGTSDSAKLEAKRLIQAATYEHATWWRKAAALYVKMFRRRLLR